MNVSEFNMENANITLRKKLFSTNIITSPTIEDISFLSTESDIPARSLPDLSTLNYPEVTEQLQATISELKAELNRAHKEIEDLLLEKSKLQAKNLEQERKINSLTKICLTSVSSSPKQNKTPKRSSRQNIHPEMKIHHEPLQFSFNTTIDNPSTSQGTQTKKDNTETTNKNVSSVSLDTIKESLSVYPGLTTVDKLNSNKDIKRILIFGSQKCTGLAKKLILSRTNTQYEKYSICAFTKPGATTKEILKNCEDLNLNSQDKLLLGIGDNDSNPTKIFVELSAILKNITNCSVIILNVKKIVT